MLKKEKILKISTVMFLLFGVFLFLNAGCQEGVNNQASPPPPLPDSVEEEEALPAPQTNEMIIVTAPEPGSVISSPLFVSGRARGTWYFEGSFPIAIMDGEGQTIVEGYAEAQGEWMTEDFVDFKASIEFATPPPEVGDQGTLVLLRDNPSGLPENDMAVEIPILFRYMGPLLDE